MFITKWPKSEKLGRFRPFSSKKDDKKTFLHSANTFLLAENILFIPKWIIFKEKDFGYEKGAIHIYGCGGVRSGDSGKCASGCSRIPDSFQ